MQNNFYITRTENAKDLPLPKPMSKSAAGLDLYANVDGNIVLEKGKVTIVPSGICISIPDGYEAQIRPRSGLAARHGITVLNTPGTIDADYRGQICIIMINLGSEDYVINRGDRIAQMVINKVEQVCFVEKDFLDETERGFGGFGHTGR